MPPARVENILRQVCGSLAEAHGHGIVHRDLKPDNVVLCERAGQKDWVEVLDFGIAKRSSEHDPNEAKLTQQGMVLGTPPYMSPEQFTGQPVDLRSDIYALGVMTYEMLVGKYPFEANTAWEWASKHMTEAPRPIETQTLGEHVPARMRDAIKRALEKNKDDRFSSVTEFYEAMTGGGALPAQTSVMNQAPTHEPHVAEAMPAGNRAKTEMGAPVAMGAGPPAGAMTPPYGGPPGGSPPMGGGPAIVPAGPTHSPPQKSGNGLVIGLAAVAVLLIGGGGLAYALRGKPKPVPTGDLSSLSASASASAAPVESAAAATTDDADASAGGTTPLGGVVTTAVGVKPGTSGGTAVKPPTSAKPVPTPTPTPAKPDPPICANARAAKARNSPAAPGLERQCISAGGKL